MEAKIGAWEDVIPHDFVDRKFAARASATFPTSAFVDGAVVALEPNTKLAVVGDTVAAAYLSRLWLEKGLTRGQWTSTRSLLDNTNLAKVGFSFGLDRCVAMSPGSPVVTEKTMATTVEALLAAVYLDGGESALARVMNHLGLIHHLLI